METKLNSDKNIDHIKFSDYHISVAQHLNRK